MLIFEHFSKSLLLSSYSYFPLIDVFGTRLENGSKTLGVLACVTPSEESGCAQLGSLFQSWVGKNELVFLFEGA